MSESAGDRLTALRKRLRLTQQTVSDRSGGSVNQGNYAKMEKGMNKLSGFGARNGLATAFGLPLAQFSAYLDGALGLDELIGQRSETTVVRDPAPSIDTRGAVSPLERALGEAFDPSRHTISDANAVRAALQQSYQLQAVDRDLVDAARVWLDAARQLRREGHEITAPNLVLRVSLGRSAHAHARDAELGAASDAEAARVAEAEGRSFGDGADAAETLRAKSRRPSK